MPDFPFGHNYIGLQVGNEEVEWYEQVILDIITQEAKFIKMRKFDISEYKDVFKAEIYDKYISEEDHTNAKIQINYLMQNSAKYDKVINNCATTCSSVLDKTKYKVPLGSKNKPFELNNWFKNK